MSEFKRVATLDELQLLDMSDVQRGYFHGIWGGTEPGSDKTRSFYHGWTNGSVDGGYAEISREQIQLARECQSGHYAQRH
jgi:hypothetical protein